MDTNTLRPFVNAFVKDLIPVIAVKRDNGWELTKPVFGYEVGIIFSSEQDMSDRLTTQILTRHGTLVGASHLKAAV